MTPLSNQAHTKGSGSPNPLFSSCGGLGESRCLGPVGSPETQEAHRFTPSQFILANFLLCFPQGYGSDKLQQALKFGAWGVTRRRLRELPTHKPLPRGEELKAWRPVRMPSP